MNTFFLAQEYSQVHLVGKRSTIDFCVVSADLFSSVIDFCAKRGAELSTNHHLVFCILRGLNHPKNRKQFRERIAYKVKCELLENKKVRHTFASKVASLFGEVPDYTTDVETEWDLFKSVVITHAADSCG